MLAVFLTCQILYLLILYWHNWPWAEAYVN